MDYISGILNLSSIDQPLNCKGLLGISSTLGVLLLWLFVKEDKAIWLYFSYLNMASYAFCLLYTYVFFLSLPHLPPPLSMRVLVESIGIGSGSATSLKYLNLYRKIKCTWLCIYCPWLVPSWIMLPSLTWKLPFFIEIEAVLGQV